MNRRIQNAGREELRKSRYDPRAGRQGDSYAAYAAVRMRGEVPRVGNLSNARSKRFLRTDHLCEFLCPGRGAVLYYLVFVDVCARK